ncbi:MAG: T9SS type A sorting domain-containing protein [Bacteroidales bacterium]|nr:T9SS type A sorting domain-containing protein [Bacteroidales bacterium]MBR3578138.1 T9SS type A sorting domain-containing protein [Bacteroidales bacterium]MBR4487447.1 T9SS type A sorting domain-containing protein [Bacteroidales bacterium]
MKKIMMAMVLSLLCTFGAFAQNYSTVPVALQNGVLVVNGVNQLSVPNYDPSEVQLEPMSGFVAVPSTDQMYTTAEYATLDAVWNACQTSAVWSSNMVTLDTYSSGGLNNGFVALKFAGQPYSYGYAKFDKTVSGGWIEFGYFTTGSGIVETSKCITVRPVPAQDVLTIDNAEGSQVMICNLNGQSVLSIPMASANEIIDVSGLSSGVYFVKVVNGSAVSMVKFVKE